MNRILYSVLYFFLVPFLVARLLFLSRNYAPYRRRIWERFGWVKEIPSEQYVIWIHSVSVGETLASVPLVKALMARYTKYRFLLTTTTPTASERVTKIYGETVEHCYMPYDFSIAVSLFLNRVHPMLAIMIETELWPNTIQLCSRRNIPVVIANARLSERSALGYGSFFMKSITAGMMKNISLVACQHIEDGDRYVRLGLDRSKLHIIGSIKYDLVLDEGIEIKGKMLRKRWEKEYGKKVILWVAASTHEGEESVIADVLTSIKKEDLDILLLLVPRHPNRFDRVYSDLLNKKMNVIRYSQNRGVVCPSTEIILGDTVGDLLLFYAAADIAFVGGSLVSIGGHNILEPAALGVPVLSGPYVHNFKVICEQLEEAGGLKIIQDKEELAQVLSHWLKNAKHSQEIGERGKQFVKNNKGALDRLLSLLDTLVNLIK